jgi:tRNA uridine 5-carbamoylmethylation protein Kti12
VTPPQTEAELRQLIDRLADPKELARWLEEILNLDDRKEAVRPPLADRASQRPDEQGRLLAL